MAVKERCFPCDAPGLPALHPDLVNYANSIGQDPAELVSSVLFDSTYLTLPLNKTGVMVTLQTVLGSTLKGISHMRPTGPVKSDIMIIGKCPIYADLSAGCVYSGEDGKVLRHAMKRAGFDDDTIDSVYVTTVLKTLPPDAKKSIKQLWLDQQKHLFWQEILLVQPKLIILQGAEAIKSLLGKSMQLTKLEECCVPLTLDLRTDESQRIIKHTVKVTCSISPVAVMYARGRLGMSQANAFSNDTTSEEKRFIRNMRYAKQAYFGDENVDQVELSGDDEDETKVGKVHTSGALKYYIVDNHRQLGYHLSKMRQLAREKVVAWDGEWQGSHPQDDGSYLRCIQFSYEPTSAVVIALTHPGGEPRFKYMSAEKQWTTDSGAEVACMMCAKYMDGMRAAGHFFNADLEWFVPLGLDLRENYAAAPSPDEARHVGGLATELAAHAIDETARFGLDEQLMTHTDCPNYNSKFTKQKATERKAILARYTKVANLLKKYQRAVASVEAGKKLTKERREFMETFDEEATLAELTAAIKEKKALDKGYGWISDEALYEYGAWDAAGELKLAYTFFLDGGLDADRFGNSCWKPYWISHRAAAAVLEINCTGLLVDKDCVDSITPVFTEHRNKLLQDIRNAFNWPDFNPQNRFQFAEALFGERYNGYYQQYGSQKRFRPEDAKTLRIMPLRTTGKYPLPWSDVMGTDKELQYTASAGKQVLSELFHSGDKVEVRKQDPVTGEWSLEQEDMSEILRLLLDYRFLSKSLQGILREPKLDDEDNEILDEEGHLVYEDGVTEYMSSDGYCRTHITQTAETGRWKSRSPNLQNCSKSREADYKRMLGDKYLRPTRSIFTSPPGYFLVEADYSGAELMLLAVMSQDQVLIDHSLRSALDESDPNYFDIHSGIAVSAFKLDCPPTKKGLSSIGRVELRVAAKAVIFGLAYGQSPAACATLLRQSGTFITADEATHLQNTVFDTYPEIRPFLNECASRVKRGWLCNMFGRYRRFFYSNVQSDVSKMEREAKNSPMQGGVADAVSLAIANIYEYRQEKQMDFRIALQVHDAIMLYVPHYELEAVIDPTDGVFKTCMVDRVPLIPHDLDGTPVSDEKYYFNYSQEVMKSWGETPTPDEFLKYDLSPTIAHWVPTEDGGYEHSDFKKKRWFSDRGLIEWSTV